MAAPYVKNMLNLTRMQLTKSWKKSSHFRKGLSFSSARRMEAESREGTTSWPKKHQAMSSPHSSMCWGSSGASSHLSPPTCGCIGASAGWGVWAAQKSVLQRALPSMENTGYFSWLKRECAATGLAKLQGTLGAFNIISINLSSAIDWKFCAARVIPYFFFLIWMALIKIDTTQ